MNRPQISIEAVVTNLDQQIEAKGLTEELRRHFDSHNSDFFDFAWKSKVYYGCSHGNCSFSKYYILHKKFDNLAQSIRKGEELLALGRIDLDWNGVMDAIELEKNLVEEANTFLS